MNIEKLVELLRVEHPCEECPHNEVHMSSCLGEDGCVYIRAAMVIEQLHLDNITLRAELAELKTNHRLTVNAGADAIRQLKDEVEKYRAEIADGRLVRLPAMLGDMVNTKYGICEVVAWDTTARLKISDELDFYKRYKDFDIGSKIFTNNEAEAALAAQEVKG